jgi:D-glycero-alpha-D-manno-heptose 1-phosphate guanylyltransferase
METDLLVLAGGYGTRLREAVPEVPKPLAPVINRPFLEHQIENWIGQGVTALTFLLFDRAHVIQTFLASCSHEGQLRGCQLRALTEPQPLGTGGAIAHAVQQFGISGSFLVANADTWLGSGVRSVSETPPPSLAVVHVTDSERYGAVRLAPNGKVASFEEKCASAGPGWVNAGLYHLHASLFEAWDGQPFSLERELLPQLAKTAQLRATTLHAEFIDIGVATDYVRFCRWVEGGKAGAL